MTTKLTALIVAFAGLAASGALAATSPPTLRDRQQAACYNDVQKLCADAMPNVDRVTACMKPKKDLVSDKCRELWDAQ